MNEIKCPHCHTLFTINESEYSQLLEQVRGQAFDEELQKRLINEIALLEEKAKHQLHEVVVKKETAITSLTNQLEQIEKEQSYLRQEWLKKTSLLLL